MTAAQDPGREPAWSAARLPRRRAWCRQDLRHARRGLAAQRAGHRCRHRLRGDPSASTYVGPDQRPRGRSAAQRSRTGAARSRRWTSTPSWPVDPPKPSSTSWRTPTCPGAGNEKRWQDVDELLDAGIDVITTVNIQHLESLNDVIERITGVRQRETVPDEVVRRADQIELVDMSPEALRRRMAHGNIYPPERVDAALANYFRPGNLSALRELALLWVADRVEENLQDYMETHGISASWETRERVVVAVTGRAGRRAARAPGGPHRRPAPWRTGRRARARRRTACESRAGPALDDQRQLLEQLGGTYREIVGEQVSDALVDFARSEKATQVVIGASRAQPVARAAPRVRWSTPSSAEPTASTSTSSPSERGGARRRSPRPDPPLARRAAPPAPAPARAPEGRGAGR